MNPRRKNTGVLQSWQTIVIVLASDYCAYENQVRATRVLEGILAHMRLQGRLSAMKGLCMLSPDNEELKRDYIALLEQQAEQ